MAFCPTFHSVAPIAWFAAIECADSVCFQVSSAPDLPLAADGSYEFQFECLFLKNYLTLQCYAFVPLALVCDVVAWIVPPVIIREIFEVHNIYPIIEKFKHFIKI
jgi:hypothetical protein